MADGWESFKIVPAMGGPSGGLITTGQQVAIQTATGNYVCAEGGGGGVVDANRTAIGPWETFTVELLGPAPIRAHQGPDMINNDNHQWMESWVIFSDSGIFFLETHTWTTKELNGFHGGVVAFLLDVAENIITNTSMYRYGVDGTWIPGLPSSQDVIQNPSFSQDIYAKTASINIYHKYAPSNQLIQDIDELKYVGQGIGDAIKSITSAV
jgi:hypothetical protein